jgi:uroporphyrinogen-III decarboxylase
MVYAAFDQPAFLEALLAQIAAWNRRRMEVVLASSVDLYIKRAWYENTLFWSPKTWKRFILPHLQADAELAHAAGAKFGYLITADCMPLLELIAEAGVDVIQGVDPARYDLAETKRRIGGRVCLWGGVNGHMTVEMGTPEAVAEEVHLAMTTLAPGGGFILSPVDNVREDNALTRRNVAALIAAWRAAAQIQV